jgi:hypothetical protein
MSGRVLPIPNSIVRVTDPRFARRVLTSGNLGLEELPQEPALAPRIKRLLI